MQSARVQVYPGEILGLVGQSGSGKSTLALAILGLLDIAGARVRGTVNLLGNELTRLKEKELRRIRGRLVSLVPQSPMTALNPALRVESQLREAWLAHSREPWSSRREPVRRLLASAGLPEDPGFLRRYPAEISVGQAQRLLIVMALLHSPPLIIADEPTSALDVVTQRDVIDLLVRIVCENRMSMLFISHDLLTVSAVCHSLSILHEGQIVESGPADKVLSVPSHPYTRQLVAAAPKWR